jgi:hypothetical protein
LNGRSAKVTTSGVSAQKEKSHVSGIARCERPDPQQTLAVEGASDHSFTISRTKCTWTKPYEIEGIGAKHCLITSSSELTGKLSRYHSYYTDEMANGDKTYYEAEGIVTLKDGVFEKADEKWKLLRGTGKMQGIKARGTCKATGNSDDSTTWVCEGEYEPPQL